MNEGTERLLTQLAEKLGTTTEYLWAVLLKQAPIDAIGQLVSIVLFACLTGIGLKAFFILWRKCETLNDPLYGKIPLMVVGVLGGMVVLILVVVITMVSFPDIISGFINPEYWALNKVLSLLK